MTAKALLLLGAFVAATAGLGWLATAMDEHWRQVVGDCPATRGTVRLLRALGGGAIAASLVLCLLADHPTIAVLVWAMALAAGAVLIAFTLSGWPRALVPLVAWAGRRAPGR